jgi:hypothetical protein
VILVDNRDDADHGEQRCSWRAQFTNQMGVDDETDQIGRQLCKRAYELQSRDIRKVPSSFSRTLGTLMAQVRPGVNNRLARALNIVGAGHQAYRQPHSASRTGRIEAHCCQNATDCVML